MACSSRASAAVVAAVASDPTPIRLDIGGPGVQQGANHAEAAAKTWGRRARPGGFLLLGVGPMPKYDPLQKHLSGQRGQKIRLSFQEIEQLIRASSRSCVPARMVVGQRRPAYDYARTMQSLARGGLQSEGSTRSPGGYLYALGMFSTVFLRMFQCDLSRWIKAVLRKLGPKEMMQAPSAENLFANVEPLNFSAVRLTSLHDDLELGPATGFFFAENLMDTLTIGS